MKRKLLTHYLHAQVDGHIGDLRRSYEEAVIARELGLPSEKNIARQRQPAHLLL